MRTTAVSLVLAGALALIPSAACADPGPLLSEIKAVGKEGAGNVAASKAVQELVQLGPGVLLDVLAAFDDADPVAANWLRAVVDTIADRELAADRPLPAARLEAFVKDRRHDGAARRLAFEWLTRVDVSAPRRLLPGMLDDPGQELRRDAVGMASADARKLLDEGDREAARDSFRKVLTSARDMDQVEEIARTLADLGVSVDLPAHFGFIRHWHLAGPFDNRGGSGFAVAYPPEQSVDLYATYAAKAGANVAWKEFTTAAPPARADLGKLAKVDLNAVVGKHMGAVTYAFAAVESPREQVVELRAATPNAVKLFLNGQEIYACQEYHHNGRLDTHIGRGVLKAGRNEVLVKVCQNEQTDPWAQEWAFQLRLCDASGAAVPLGVLPATPMPNARARHDRTRWPLIPGVLVAALLMVWLWVRGRRAFSFARKMASLALPAHLSNSATRSGTES